MPEGRRRPERSIDLADHLDLNRKSFALADDSASPFGTKQPSFELQGDTPASLAAIQNPDQ
jgi:hypothetical protein